MKHIEIDPMAPVTIEALQSRLTETFQKKTDLLKPLTILRILLVSSQHSPDACLQVKLLKTYSGEKLLLPSSKIRRNLTSALTQRIDEGLNGLWPGLVGEWKKDFEREYLNGILESTVTTLYESSSSIHIPTLKRDTELFIFKNPTSQFFEDQYGKMYFPDTDYPEIKNYSGYKTIFGLPENVPLNMGDQVREN